MIKSKIQMKQAQVQIQNTDKDTNTNMKTNTNKNTNTNTDWQEAELLAPPCNMASNLHSWPHPLLKHLSLSFIEEKKKKKLGTICWASHFPPLLVNFMPKIKSEYNSRGWFDNVGNCWPKHFPLLLLRKKNWHFFQPGKTLWSWLDPSPVPWLLIWCITLTFSPVFGKRFGDDFLSIPRRLIWCITLTTCEASKPPPD